MASAAPSYLPVIRTITNSSGHSFAPTDEMRILAGLSAEVVTGDGPDRIEIGYEGAVASLSAGTGIAIAGTAEIPIINATPSSASVPGTMSAADFTKLAGITEGAAVTNVGVTGALTLGGSIDFPIIGIPAASGIVAGSMSAADFTKLAGMTSGAAVASVAGGTAVTMTGTATAPVVNVNASSGAALGTMSAAHYTLVNGATASDTASTIVMRGASHEIAATTVNALDVNAAGTGLIETIEVGADGTGAAIFHCAVSTAAWVDAYAATVTMRGVDGGHHEVTLTSNVTFAAPTDYSSDPALELFVIQGGTGSYTASWALPASGGFSFLTGVSSSLIATSVGDADYFRFKHRSAPTSHWVCVAHGKYSPP